ERTAVIGGFPRGMQLLRAKTRLLLHTQARQAPLRSPAGLGWCSQCPESTTDVLCDVVLTAEVSSSHDQAIDDCLYSVHDSYSIRTGPRMMLARICSGAPAGTYSISQVMPASANAFSLPVSSSRGGLRAIS